MGGFSDGPGLYCSAPPEKTNYRSLGRGAGGVPVTTARKKKQGSRNVQAGPTIPSIPGKFETVLYRNNREDKGFGSRAPRFGQEARESELPGPGTSPSDSAGGIDKAVGKRGLGPFASRTPRHQIDHAAAQAPGPGYYGVVTPSSSSKACSGAAHVFMIPSSVNPAKFNARASPGPGDYSGAVGQVGRAKVDATGALMRPGDSTTPRHGKTKDDTPGPGSYDATNRSFSEVSAAHGRRGISVPKHRCSQSSEAIADDSDKILSEVALMRASAQMLAEEKAQSSAGPGPGQYDPKPELTSYGGQISFSSGESASFQVGLSHMPRKHREHHPGPGEYEPAPPASPKKLVLSFDSTPGRFKEKVPLAPGPAYYSPRKIEQGDFFLNTKNLWL